MTRRPMRILITGSRTWTDRTAIAQAISDYLRSVGTSIGGAWPFPIVVHGGARGADQLADAVARNWGWTPERHPADWDRHGRAAGFRRNAAMVAWAPTYASHSSSTVPAGPATPPGWPKPPVSPPTATSGGPHDDYAFATQP